MLNMELSKIYSLSDFYPDLEDRYYPDGDVLNLWVYRTNDYLYITDFGDTDRYWLDTVLDVRSDPKYYMIPKLIDAICEYLGVMYQDNQFVAAIPLSSVTTYTDQTAHLNEDALQFEIMAEADALFQAIATVTTLFGEY